MPAHIDTTSSPIILHTLTGNLELPDLALYLHQQEQLLQGDTRFVSIIVATKFGKAETQAIRQYVYWFRKNRELASQKWLGMALVFDALPRFLFSLYLLVGNLPAPYFMADRFESALAWSLERLSQAKIPHPATLPKKPIL